MKKEQVIMEMLPSEMPKDAKGSIRLSSAVKKLLEAKGLTIQSLFDKAVDQEIKKFTIKS